MSKKQVEGNKQWETRCKESFPADVEARIKKFLDYAYEWACKRNHLKYGCDVGAGNGYIVDWFNNNHGCEMDGFDYYPQRPEFKKMDLNEENAFSGYPYEFVICNHTIEHTLSPSQTLMNLASMLDTGGLMVCSCPSAGTISNLAKPFDLSLGHVSYWTVTIVLGLAEELGLDILDVKTVETSEGYIELFFVLQKRT